MESVESPKLKIIVDDMEIDFEAEIYGSEEIVLGLDEINGRLSSNKAIIDAINKDINFLTNSADGPDYIVAVGSGVLAGIVDSLWVGEFDFHRGKAWSNKTVNEVVMKAAKERGYQGDRLDGAIKFLEDKFPIPSDSIWNGNNLGISARSHHLDDLAHHPTPIGLFCAILMQFTKEGYFHNSEGKRANISIDENDGSLIGGDVPHKIFAGAVNWFFHLVSDMSGSNKTAGVGMGIPGPIVALLKEFSIIPGMHKTGLAKELKEIFVKERFDLRSEMAVGHELARQAVPVIMNEVIVRVFYFIRRLLIEINEKKSFEKIEWKKTLPWKNRTIVRMLTIATGTFTLVDLADAGVRSYIKSGCVGVDPKELLMRVNFVGVGRFAIAITTDVSMGINREKLRSERMAIFSEQLHLMNAKVYYLQADAWKAAETTAKTLDEAVVTMERSAVIFVESWKANRISMKQISEYRNGIALKNQGLIEDIVNDLKYERAAVSAECEVVYEAKTLVFGIPVFDENNLPEVIQGQVTKLEELNDSVEKAKRAAQNAKASAEKAKSISTGIVFNKNAIEVLQSAGIDLAEAGQSTAEALKISFEFHTKLAEITKYLFGLGTSNIALNRIVVRELELKLKGASQEELSELARQEILLIVKQLKDQEDTIKKQENLANAVRAQTIQIADLEKNNKRLEEKVKLGFLMLVGNVVLICIAMLGLIFLK